MRHIAFIFNLLIFVFLSIQVNAQLLNDYSHIRGNHYFGWHQDEQTICR